MTTAAAVRRLPSPTPTTPIPTSPTPTPRSASFAALRSRNYRLYLAGQSFANTGTWMQTVAQDWLVLQLTHSSTAVGVTMALQFTPTLLLGGCGGLLADRFDKRRLLLATQSANAVLTSLLAVLTVTGVVRPAHVFVFALLAGTVFAIDGPARQTFVGEVVGLDRLPGAIALNSAVFQTTRLVGPAVAGVLVASVGTGWVFALNALCYLGPTAGLLALRRADLRPAAPAPRTPHALRDAVRHVARRPQVAWTLLLVGVVGTFGLNFPVVLTAMASETFHGDAATYGLFNIALAVGSVTGALLAGTHPGARFRVIVLAGAAFGAAQLAAAQAPDLGVFLVLLVVTGVVNLAFQALANASVQLGVDPAMRGRVMGLYLLVFTGGTPLGAPLVGAITAHWGARVGMGFCGLVPLVAGLAVAIVLVRARARARARVRTAAAARPRAA